MADLDGGIRRERAGVVFPRATWTSFDRHDRYGAIITAIRGTMGAGPRSVLDVGDAAGHLGLFDADLHVIGLDLHPVERRLEGAVPVRADGMNLPFPDASFDVVVSSDVLEHIPPERRERFLGELRRVSRDLVIVAAPFDTPGVAGVEELVRRYALLAAGTEQAQLEEHRRNGLPDLSAAESSFVEAGWRVTSFGNGNLWDWATSMLWRFQVEARPALAPLVGGFDVFYNTTLADRCGIGPFYRHVVVSRATGPVGQTRSPGHSEPNVDSDVDPDIGPVSTETSLALITALLVAGGTEVSRQDVVPRLDALTVDVGDLHARIELLSASVESTRATLDHVVRQNAELRGRLEELFAVQMRANRPSLALQGLLGRLRGAIRR